MTLTGKLLDGNDAYRWIADALSNAEQPIDICSAFLRSEALSALLHGAPKSLSGRILVRWRLNDLIAGASDFEAYDIAVARGFEVYMRLDFHGKVYALPPLGVLVGSANATLSGMGLKPNANGEVCTLVPYDEACQHVIDDLFSEAKLVDRELFSALSEACSHIDEPALQEQSWPVNIIALMSSKSCETTLLVDKCFWSGPSWTRSSIIDIEADVLHDQKLLGFRNGSFYASNLAGTLNKAFRRTEICQWLVSSVTAAGGEMYFGQLSFGLQHALADFPAPSRATVKLLLKNLLGWVSLLLLDEIVVDTPRYSQRVRIIGGAAVKIKSC